MTCNRSIPILLAAATFLAACASPAKVEEHGPATAPAPAPSVQSPARPTPVVQESDVQRNLRALKVLSASSIYFDYERFDIKPEFQTVLARDADALRGAPHLKIRLEGNADERGGSEYNLALGQKRAEAVRRALTLLGIPDDQMEAISYGKEKPRATCHEERCWAENRRVDFAER
jgi:peptidoglycan-associated lipoprotein